MSPAMRARLVAARARALLVARPVLHTFWQAFAATLGVWWTASGADLLNQVSDVGGVKRFGAALLVAAAAAALSAVKNLAKQYVRLSVQRVAVPPPASARPTPGGGR